MMSKLCVIRLQPRRKKSEDGEAFTDDQRWDALGVVQKEQGDQGRFPWLKTPNMDRLAGDGVRFRNAFVVTSLCSPSRANFLTGQYGHSNGVKGNAEGFPVTNITCASLLTGAGYATGYFGKWHMGEQRGKRPGFTTSTSFVGHGRKISQTSKTTLHIRNHPLG